MAGRPYFAMEPSPISDAAETPHQKLFAMCSKHVVYALGFSAVVSLLNLVPTLYMLQIYDRVLASKSEMTLLFLSIFTVAALGLLAYIDGVRSKILASLGIKLEQTLWHHITVASLVEGAVRKSKSALTPAEFEVVKNILTGPVALSILDLPWSFLYICIAFVLHWAIGLFALVAFVIFILLAILYEASTSSLMSESLRRGQAQQIFQADVEVQRETIRSLGMVQSVTLQLSERRKASQSPQRASQAIASHYGAVVKFIRLFLQSATLGLAAFLAIKGDITPGAIFASSMLASRALAPMEGLLGQWRNLAQARPMWLKLRHFFALPVRSKPMEFTQPETRLRIERVSLLSVDRNRYLIRDVTLEASPGLLVIAGPSGSGKTLLLKIIANAFLPDAGTVRIGSTDYAQWDSDRLGPLIGYSPQEPSFIPGRIKDNLSRFRAADTSQIVMASKVAGAHEMIMSLPDGYDTFLTGNGAPLSPGQKQRLALARAVYGAPRLYVLDDPIAGLDGEGEIALLALIRSLKASGAIVIVATHRTSLMAMADSLIIMKEGRCVAQGVPADVMSALRAKTSDKQPLSGPLTDVVNV